MCNCGRLAAWHPLLLDEEHITTLDGARFIEEPDDYTPRPLWAVWDGTDFNPPVAPCITCGTSYVHTPAHSWLTRADYDLVAAAYPHGVWNSQPAPPPITAGDASFTAHIDADAVGRGGHQPATFSWVLTRAGTRTVIASAGPDPDEVAALRALAADHGEAALHLLADLTANGAALAHALEVAGDTLS